MICAVPSKQFSLQRFETGVSRYDRYVSALISSLILVGLAVVILFLSWLAAVEWSTTKETAIADKLTGYQSPVGIAEDFEEPIAVELTDVQEPQLIDGLRDITKDPSTLKAVYAVISENIDGMGPGKQGDHRTVGDCQDETARPEKQIADADRWDIRYSTASRAEYAKQLDYLKIELGAISMKTDHIAYLSDLSAEKPTASIGNRDSERAKKRIFFFRYPEKSTSKLKRWDLEFLEAAEVPTSGRMLVQFYPNETRQMLLALEQKELGDKSLQSVLKTTFGVRATKAGFEYYVIDIKYR